MVEALFRVRELLDSYLGTHLQACFILAIVTHSEVLPNFCEGEDVGDSVGHELDGVWVASQIAY